MKVQEAAASEPLHEVGFCFYFDLCLSVFICGERPPKFHKGGLIASYLKNKSRSRSTGRFV